MVNLPEIFKIKNYETPEETFNAIKDIYETHISYLQKEFRAFSEGKIKSGDKVSACYPYVKAVTKFAHRSDMRLSYGFVPRPGIYTATLTRPDIFEKYYLEQFSELIRNHEISLEVGVSKTPIPIHFALGDRFHLERDLSVNKIRNLPDIFDVPDLNIMDDEIANGAFVAKSGKPYPLSLFTAQRVDLSLQRLKHYCGSTASHFQKFIIFTNYQFYIDEFIALGKEQVKTSEYTEFIEPVEDKRLPQMPAYHLKREDGSGITMVNIGVGPSNAKTITDHIAVLRPHAWLMLGHCAGLRNSQKLGDYVLAHGYLREDQILDDDLPLSIPVPALAEVQVALEKAVAQVTGEEGYDLKKIMRTGTVATTDDRNWELRPSIRQNLRLSQSRAIAMDMESGTISANGFRFRVPYGTLLCVSDKPFHGQLKLPGMADNFYRERVEQHLKVGLLAMTMLRDLKPSKLHSRKLRSFNEVAFQ